jgi:hypothetical protein
MPRNSPCTFSMQAFKGNEPFLGEVVGHDNGLKEVKYSDGNEEEVVDSDLESVALFVNDQLTTSNQPHLRCDDSDIEEPHDVPAKRKRRRVILDSLIRRHAYRSRRSPRWNCDVSGRRVACQRQFRCFAYEQETLHASTAPRSLRTRRRRSFFIARFRLRRPRRNWSRIGEEEG